MAQKLNSHKHMHKLRKNEKSLIQGRELIHRMVGQETDQAYLQWLAKTYIHS